ncbi:hypothetical protein HSISS2_1168 [Streptococcus sp. HSISS2]|nr:hypothetical protein HSISS3_1534 [Streptococcus sp. HSISS3]EQC75250.1 hypothetical protein HSISS2_1168 [Streptococcus sp. HSISS2]KXU58545.1 hypothetical protein HMPREF3219_0200791 [Streptococcus salivarius]
MFSILKNKLYYFIIFPMKMQTVVMIVIKFSKLEILVSNLDIC